MTIQVYVFACPRCDRPYKDVDVKKALEKVQVHVAGQHPDHDPFWYETYPDTVKTEFAPPQNQGV